MQNSHNKVFKLTSVIKFPYLCSKTFSLTLQNILWFSEISHVLRHDTQRGPLKKKKETDKLNFTHIRNICTTKDMVSENKKNPHYLISLVFFLLPYCMGNITLSNSDENRHSCLFPNLWKKAFSHFIIKNNVNSRVLIAVLYQTEEVPSFLDS